MNKLPKIFSKARWDLPKSVPSPTTVLLLGDEEEYIERQKPAANWFVSEQEKSKERLLNVWQNAWVEFRTWAMWIIISEGEHMTVSFYTLDKGKAYRLDSYTLEDPFQSDWTEPEILWEDPQKQSLWDDQRGFDKQKARAHEVRMYFSALVYIYWLSQQPKEVSVNTMTRNKTKVFERQGDTIRYTKLDDLRTAAGQATQRDYDAPEPGASGIRKCEHDVRGHWRTYKSGVRVWVKSHKRGDPELGTTTRVLT